MRYDVPWLRDRLATTDPFSARSGAVLDVDLSIALLRYALHMALGHPAGEDRTSSARATDVLRAFDDMRAPTTLRAASSAGRRTLRFAHSPPFRLDRPIWSDIRSRAKLRLSLISVPIKSAGCGRLVDSRKAAR